MKILRSEAVDKSPGVFYDPEHDLKAPGTPGAIKQAKKPNFSKNPKISKNCKKIRGAAAAPRLPHEPLIHSWERWGAPRRYREEERQEKR